MSNPSHLLVLALAAGLLVLFVRVLISILRSGLSTGMKVLWILFVLWVPLIAWFAWYLIGRPAAPPVRSTP
ncbi:hypothetical protein KIH74_28050 [Kineosporia sp. J2-2]|uniref:Phospholipase_D-nuclease N-terminal n=1 Tax=Kineosporia corallincola TaxID=2835133 RepID=A0ABS5TP07_9ACTN|nr:hypothetical protein [Kineosporia corallincola]MBT0772827.1 hypothetical protein [Kineosporia corallincola]